MSAPDRPAPAAKNAPPSSGTASSSLPASTSSRAGAASAASASSIDSIDSSPSASGSSPSQPRVLSTTAESALPTAVIVIGMAGSGKCWAAGTLLRLYDGEVKAVETFVGGELLMGSDGLPRVVTPGSVTTGRAPLYKIKPQWEGAQPFTVNGAHILVLTVNCKPYASRAGNDGYGLFWLEIDSNNMLRRRGKRCLSKQAADLACAQKMKAWRPLTWEVSVDAYLTVPAYLQLHCKLYASRALTFQPRADALHLQLAAILGTVPSAAQVAWAAWYVGVWVTDGDSGSAVVYQGGARPPDPHHHRQVMTRLLQYQQLFGEAAQRLRMYLSSAGHRVYRFQFGGGSGAAYTASIAHRLLLSYGLIDNKHVPQAWLCDTVEVRRRICAGVLDGDGYYNDSNNVYEVCMKRRRFARDLKTLFGSLGLRNGKADDKQCTNPETGEVYDGFRVHVSGDMWKVVQYCALTYKQCPQPGQAKYVAKNRDSRCYGFDVEPLPVGNYHGFAVHGGVNRRILLADFTVTHNTTLMQRLLSHLSSTSVPHYAVNLDPAVTYLPYSPNIDIRDTVHYKQVMEQYGLGPNGGILTSLNLFATRFDQVLQLVDRRAAALRLLLLDTPGQIEIFTWSASGAIISEALASSYPTVILYVVDTPRCQAPSTFMSNMLYACSIAYKSQLPFLLCFNKTDILSHQFATQWMTDPEAFAAALAASPSSASYMSSLTRSMSLLLDEFYSSISAVGVSAVTGDGVDGLLQALDKARGDFYTGYALSLAAKVERRHREEESRKEKMREKLRRDRAEGETAGLPEGLQGRLLVDMKRRSRDEEEAEEEEEERRRRRGEEEDEDDVDEAEDQDDEFERRLAEQREKADYDEFMQRLRAQRGRVGDDVEEEDENKTPHG